MTPALRKALVETGAIIPTTPGEVRLAQSALARYPNQQEVDAAFVKLEQALGDTSPAPFMQLNDCVAPSADGGLSMAARNGEELDPDTLARVEESIAQAARKSSQP